MCVFTDGWMDGWIHACMHVCMYVCIWSRVPCSRESELGGPYHWGVGPGIRSPDIYIYIYIHIYIYIFIYQRDVFIFWCPMAILQGCPGGTLLGYAVPVTQWLCVAIVKGFKNRLVAVIPHESYLILMTCIMTTMK